jgi:asparagine synthase (glutamine-hydrolysing)
MLRGVYSTSGGSARDLDAFRRLESKDSELIVRGPLAIAWNADSPVSFAEVDGLTCLVDGRLYDVAELARELDGGVSNAAELVARAYRRHGKEALTTLRGRFCVVLWDAARAEGFLASDLLAVQPFFLRRGTGWLAFASELRDLLECLPSRPGPDPFAFANWLGGGECPSGRTPFEGVDRLRPGRLVDLKAGAAETRRYWAPRYRGTRKGSRAEHVEGLREELERSVRRRLSPLSSSVVLSGGLDSSVVAAVASRVKGADAGLQTYSTVFPEHPELDESWKVRSLTSALEIEPGTYAVEPHGALWLGLQYAKQWSLPLLGAGALIDAPMVGEAARAGTDIVLDGQGGDETLGLSPFLISDRLRRGRLLSALRLTREWPVGRPTTRNEQRWILKEKGLKAAVPHGWERRPSTRRNLLDSHEPAWLLPEARRRYLQMEDRWAWKGGVSGPRWWRYLADVHLDLHHRHFRFDYVRHRARAAGLVAESPLYDFDLVEYCLSLPPELSYASAFSRPLARDAMRGLIPDDVRENNVKANFSPFCFDVLTGGDAPGIETLLMAPDAELGGFVDMDWVRRRWLDRPERGPTSTMIWGTQMWMLAAAECWLRSQADPSFVDEMLARPDVRPPTVHRTTAGEAGTFSHLATA